MADKEKGLRVAAGPEAVDKSLGDVKAGFQNKLGDVLEILEGARESLDDALETGRTTVQERPLVAVGVALAVGVAIGLFFATKE